ncbi:hypothetical protein B0T13DRAFT_453025 [Neurospora crassa]|nr:hypothetical protein B0T13DRAFT_453025 [Neurospora crassa]
MDQVTWKGFRFCLVGGATSSAAFPFVSGRETSCHRVFCASLWSKTSNLPNSLTNTPHAVSLRCCTIGSPTRQPQTSVSGCF